jgi:hypothetical protein
MMLEKIIAFVIVVIVAVLYSRMMGVGLLLSSLIGVASGVFVVLLAKYLTGDSSR